MKIIVFLLGTVGFLLSSELITPIEIPKNINEQKATLGKELFFDTKLSKDNTVSCATCHILEDGGDDNMKFSFGIKGQEGNINAPTVFNSVYNFRQFWNGRSADLAAQAKEPIINPIEMGNTHENAVATLKKERSYQEKFQKIYQNGITIDNIADAIAEFEKKLVTPDAPFDLYLKGDESAIDEDTKRGYELFKSKGCIACHNGINVGGNLYSKFGAMYSAGSKSTGRFEVTGKEEDKFFFKVPSLRNIEKTAPYLHDGRTESLKGAIAIMSNLQLGREISADEIRLIEKFLISLTGKNPEY